MSIENDVYVAGLVTAALGVQAAATELLLDGWGRADVHVALGAQRHLFVEVETNQKHPSTNVLKYWPWLEVRSDDRVILVHAFMRPVTVSPNRLQLARWTGDRMTKSMNGRFWYCRLEIAPGPGIAEGMDSVITAMQEMAR